MSSSREKNLCHLPAWPPAPDLWYNTPVDVLTLLQQLINGLSLGSLYALIAIGYTLVGYSALSLSGLRSGRPAPLVDREALALVQ